MLALLILLPLLLGIAAIALAKPGQAKHIALAMSLVSLLLIPFGTGSGSFTWLSIGNLSIDFVISTSPLNLMLLSLVAFMAPFVLYYSFGYMVLPSEQKRYYAEMLAFESAMLLFAISGSFVVLFIAWEFLSMTSYLLIGFWYNRERALHAARKVISIILIGDFTLFASMVVFLNAYGTLSFSQIIAGMQHQGASPAVMLAVLLLVIALFTKSAQFPFHEWLSDAMEGPTPVSAMLHSTTMVKAGVFAAIVLLPLIMAAHENGLLLIIGLLTAFIAAFNASREMHIKRVLAYSTIEELSLMFVALGANAVLAAIYFFIAQSFYKALLFFSSGSVMTATENEQLDKTSGLSSNRLLWLTTLFGVIALAGFVPFDGFFANIGLSSAFTGNILVYALISAISLITSFYIFRWFFLCSKPAIEKREEVLYSALPKSMVYSGAALASMTLIASAFFFFIPSMFPDFAYGKPLFINPLDAAVELSVISVGAFLAAKVYWKKSGMQNRIANFAQTTWLFNLFYFLVAEFFYILADGILFMDLYLDSLFEYIGSGTESFAAYVRRIATGQINLYAAVFIIGMIVLLFAVVY